MLYFAASCSELLKKNLIAFTIAILYENWSIAIMRIETRLETSQDESEGMGEANLETCLLICDSAAIYHPQRWNEEKSARVRSFSQPSRKTNYYPYEMDVAAGHSLTSSFSMIYDSRRVFFPQTNKR
jgi:hypothetical protein